ncbi:hypothetical protein D3C75_923640 [compost metagenome]
MEGIKTAVLYKPFNFFTLEINNEKNTINGTWIHTEKRINQPLFLTDIQNRSSPNAFS